MKITTSFLLIILMMSASLYSQNPNYFKEKKVMAISNPILNMSKDIGYLKGLKYQFLLGAKENELNGKYRTYQPLLPLMSPALETDQALELDMKMAQSMGIDGFEFPLLMSANPYYLDRLSQTIVQYVNLAEKKKMDFSFALKINLRRNPKQLSEDELMLKLERILLNIYSNTSFSEKWLRNSNNQIVLFTTISEGILDESINVKTKELATIEGLVEKIYHQYHELSKHINHPISFVYETKLPYHEDYNREVLDYFDAISITKHQILNKKGADILKSICKEKKKGFVCSATPDKFSSQMIVKSTDQKVKGKSELSKTLKLSDIYLLYQNLNLSEGYRKLLELAIDNDADLIRIDSWNHYNNATHIAPEVHHGFGYGLLLKYYKNIWLNKGEFLENELLLTAYKSYPSKCNKNFDVEVRFDDSYYPDATEDSIEVVSVLNEVGEVYVNGKRLGKAEKGLNTFRIPMTEGTVNVALKRYGKEVISYTTSKAITFSPQNVDGITYLYSNMDVECVNSLFQKVSDYKKKDILNRFIVSENSMKKWEELDKAKYEKAYANFLQFGYDSKKFSSLNNTIETKYLKSVKSFMDDMEYNIWLKMYITNQNKHGDINLFEPIEETEEEGFVLEQSEVSQ
ncbi:hypothetical protein MY04_4276 [Flammeovirga sp. MY04]|uniref:hypothetical protein n=1 Tax=Flammeovirga sp. MY04 TaxID=1191459 RepID=UPI000806131B|nr:hypothetical protein [Flammeovirga sp. MY04]ANQ51618.1 hypothetical protein MY04_4276 [Flammeovirga sp. MY04]